MNQSNIIEPEGRWLNVDGLNMHYIDWGEGKNPLIALHGAASSCHWYDLTAPHLAKSFRVIALDQRAHGKTDQPDTGYDWPTLAMDVIGALDQLGISRAAVIGHSWGASVALSLAALHPERITALVMVDGGFSSGARSSTMTWDEYKSRLSPRDIYGPKDRYLGALQRQFSHCWNDRLEHIVMTMVRSDPDGTVHERLDLSNQQQMLWAMWSDPTQKLLARVECPTLLVAAEGHPQTRSAEYIERRQSSVTETIAQLKNSKAQWVTDSGHDIGYEQPEELAKVITNFLNN